MPHGYLIDLDTRRRRRPTINRRKAHLQSCPEGAAAAAAGASNHPPGALFPSRWAVTRRREADTMFVRRRPCSRTALQQGGGSKP